MKKNTVINKEVSLSKRADGDKISTLSTAELGLKGKAPQGSTFKVRLLGGIDVEFISNRKDGTSLAISNKFLPRFVTLPRQGKPTALRVMSFVKLY